jgi:glucosyl-3-phosphoglycerate synthase
MLPEVQDWLVRRSSHASDWPAGRVAELKGSTTVAVVLPALNEEATVGRIVETIRRGLVERHHVVDELVVVDSGSTDGTHAAATAAGARVVRTSEVLPHIATAPGKGEALWRGVAATTSDVVCFVDSDLRDFSTGFVTGLAGPLVADPSLRLVKATYDRALTQGVDVLPTGGGRVTELVARPILDAFWPLLAGFVQPLGGEYAARRSLLEQISFPVGYGVEMAVLVDALQLSGLDALAQVDLVRRKHRNSETVKLGRMAAEILHVSLGRLERDRRLMLTSPIETTLVQFERVAAEFRAVEVDVPVDERPPLSTVAAYRGRA